MSMKMDHQVEIKETAPQAGDEALSALSVSEEKPLTASSAGTVDTESAATPPGGFTDTPLPTDHREQVEQWQLKAAKADEYWDRLIRLTADFDNYKKRAVRERQDAVKFANEALVTKLISVLDNFDMALMAANNSQGASIDSLKTGINMIYSQLRSVLTEAGVEEIEATNQRFDPNLHEAVSQRETSASPEGQVVEQLRKGYKLRERLLRPAMVVVAKAPAA